MLLRKRSPIGKKLYRTKGSLINHKDAYVAPHIDFKTSTSIWNVDEFIKRRIRDWRRITDEDGHTGERAEKFRKDHFSVYTGTYSVFPIPLVEWILIRYGGGPGSKILDAFSGGPARAIAASIMGYEYHGFEIRKEQIEENEATIKDLKLDGITYHFSDGRFLNGADTDYDVALTCPPYYDLEQYSDQVDDVSNLPSYAAFNASMWQCACSHLDKMKPGAFVCIVVGNFRDKHGELIDFRGHTVQNFKEAGFLFWQDIILSKNFASAAKRAGNAWRGKKLVPRHEHLLIFRTPER